MKNWLIILLLIFNISGCSTTNHNQNEQQVVVKKTNVEKTFDEINQLVNDYYIGTIDENALSEGVAKGFAQGLDENTEFFGIEEYKSFTSNVTGSMIGLGLQFVKSQQGALITNVLQKSPAEDASIKPGDVIVSIDNQDIDSHKISTIAKLLKGEAGTNVMLEIVDGDNGKTKIIVAKRNPFDMPTIKVIEDDGIPIIKIRFFSHTTAKEVLEYLNKSVVKAPIGLIFDLQGNPGGSLDAAQAVLSMILKENSVIAQIKYKMSIQNDLLKTIPRVGIAEYAKIPVAVIVDGESASASELFSAAIRDNMKGFVLGSKTFGKGTVQDIVPIKSIPGSGLKMTIGEYFSPNGDVINDKGIKPDYNCESDGAVVDGKCDLIDFAKKKLRDYY